MLFDTHCHLDFDEFDGDRAAVWQSCRDSGVVKLMIPGVTPGNQWDRSRRLAEQEPGIYYSLGVHPCWLTPWHNTPVGQVMAGWSADIDRHLQSPQCRALGETGLDKRIETSLAVQVDWFEWHLTLAQQHRRPLILHCVHAHAELLALLKRNKPVAGGVVHAFNGSYDIAREYWSLGIYLGIGGTITYARANKTRNAVQRMPLEALVLETDAPDMPLQGRQGQRNSPAFLTDVAACLAQLHNQSLAVIAQQTYSNSCRLFGLTESHNR